MVTLEDLNKLDTMIDTVQDNSSDVSYLCKTYKSACKWAEETIPDQLEEVRRFISNLKSKV